jgi:hypothetical protein
MKTTGGTSTSGARLWAGAAAARTGLRTQLLRLRPTVVICGGTFKSLIDASVIPERAVKETRTGMRCARVGGVTYLEARHPGHRGSHKEDYEIFVRSARQGLAR